MNESREKTGRLTPSQMGKVATSMVLLYHVFFGLGFSTVPWVYSAEVNSLGWRTRGAAAATSVNWFFGFVVVQITKVGLDHLKWRFFLSKRSSCSQKGDHIVSPHVLYSNHMLSFSSVRRFLLCHLANHLPLLP